MRMPPCSTNQSLMQFLVDSRAVHASLAQDGWGHCKMDRGREAFPPSEFTHQLQINPNPNPNPGTPVPAQARRCLHKHAQACLYLPRHACACRGTPVPAQARFLKTKTLSHSSQHFGFAIPCLECQKTKEKPSTDFAIYPVENGLGKPRKGLL